MPKESWGPGQLAPLEIRKANRRKALEDARGTPLVHATELASIRARDAALAQTVSTPAALTASPAAPPAAPPAGQPDGEGVSASPPTTPPPDWTGTPPVVPPAAPPAAKGK